MSEQLNTHVAGKAPDTSPTLNSHAFLASELPVIAPEAARFHILSAPFEASVSYGGGTANGPARILEASDQLELWDGTSIPADEGLYTWPTVDCSGTVHDVLHAIEAATERALAVGGIPILLGGEHTVSLGALRALAKRHESFGIIQFDAHADLRDEYEGNAYSHACVMRRALEEGKEENRLRLFQFGVRALCTAERDVRAARGVGHLDAAVLARQGVPAAPLPPDFPEKIYISFDIDGLDPSIMPATGTPVPGGLGWYQALECLERCVAGRTVIGADVVEFAPIEGLHYADATAAQLTYAIMGVIQRHALK